MQTKTRRQILTGAASGILIVKPETAFGSQANSAVSLGIIGAGNRGAYDGAIFVKDPRARLVALCDISNDKIDNAKTVIPGIDKIPVHKDYRDLLARTDIDAVLIATPIFLHPEHFEAAAKARKHIYCEKAAGADVAGVKRLLRASGEADKSKHIQFGFQQRHSPEYLAAEKILRSSEFGDLLYSRAYWIYPSLNPNPNQKPNRNPTDEQKLRNWYPWKALSGDIIVEQHCHGIDVLNWFAGAHPVKASGVGGRTKANFNGDTMDHLDVTFTYPDGLHGHLSACKVGPIREVKEMFWSATAMLHTDRSFYKYIRIGQATQQVDSKREITIDAIENFLTKIVTAKPENEAPRACESTFTSLLGRMALYERREATWDEMMRSAQ